MVLLLPKKAQTMENLHLHRQSHSLTHSHECLYRCTYSFIFLFLSGIIRRVIHIFNHGTYSVNFVCQIGVTINNPTVTGCQSVRSKRKTKTHTYTHINTRSTDRHHSVSIYKTHPKTFRHPEGIVENICPRSRAVRVKS